MALFDGLFGPSSNGAGSASGGSNSVTDLFSDPTFLVGLQLIANGSQKRLLTDPRGPLDGVPQMLAAAAQFDKNKKEAATNKLLAGLDPEADIAKARGGSQPMAPMPTPAGQKVGGLGDLGGFTPSEVTSTYTQPQNAVGGEGVASGLPSMAGQPMPSVASTGDDLTTSLIKQKESFRQKPYWDVNALRTGYGSDTVTLPDGTVKPVDENTVVNKEDADRDLKRRIGEFQSGVKQMVGDDAWNALPEQAKAAVTSVAYNYGSLAKLPSLVSAIKAGDTNKIADAIESYSGHNDGVNARRRQDEAALVRSASGQPQQQRAPSNQVASIDPTFVPSPATPNKALDGRMLPGLGLSRLPDAAVMPADQARAPQEPPAQPMSYADAMASKPQNGGQAGFSTDLAPGSMQQAASQSQPAAAPPATTPQPTGNNALDQMRKDAALKAKYYGDAINKYTLAGKTPPATFTKNYDQAMKLLEPTEVEKALMAANIPLNSPQGRKAMMKQAGIGPSEFDEKLDKAFPDPNDPRRQIAAQAAVQMGPSDAAKKLDEMVKKGIISPSDSDYGDNAKQLYGIKKEAGTSGMQEAEFLRTATPEQRQAFMDAKAAARPQTNVNVDTKGESAFETEFGKKAADRWAGYLTAGDKAQSMMGDVNAMRELSNRIGSQGQTAAFKVAVGPYAEALGINIDGLSDLQAYNAVIKKIAPQMRQAGSGSTSDIEYKGFLDALPAMTTSPAARTAILDTMEGFLRNDMQRADLATQLANKEVTRSEAEKKIRNMPDPLTSFRKFKTENPDLFVKQKADQAPPVTRPTASGPGGQKLILSEDGKSWVPMQ